jgi:transketolase
MKTLANPTLDQMCVNTLRTLSIDMVQKANSGHPGLPLGAAPMAYALWKNYLKHNPANPQWFDRDRFVLSAGHGSALLYSLLHMTGYDLSLDDIKKFRQWESKTPGHPERGLTPGVEVTTGPLGQGFGNGVGMAIAEAHLAARYNRPDFKLIDHYTYGIVSDGDLMEGIASEAASLAGHLKLGKLIYLYDQNHVTLSAATDITFTENAARRFEAYGWHTQSVADGNDLEAISTAIEKAKQETRKPSLILVRTHIGFGSPHKKDTFEAHGSPLGEEEVKLTKQALGWQTEPTFYIPDEALKGFREAVSEGKKAESEWNIRCNHYATIYPKEAQEFRRMLEKELPQGWDKDIPSFPADAKGVSTRVAGGKILNAIAKNVPAIMGGSADLDPSTYTHLNDFSTFEPQDPNGRNVAFGVREHAMGAILNGMAAHGGFIPFGATFLTFSDYMRPTIRLAALMKLSVAFVFTHDSIALGEDGPTHQSVEHVAALRAIPQLCVIRPGDANETAMAWRMAVESRDCPTALILTRQNVPTLDRTKYAPADGLEKGAYVLADSPSGKVDLILIATGSEVGLIVEAREKLLAKNIQARLVSMPCWELFDAQPQAYRDSVLLPLVERRLSVEAGISMGWRKYVGDKGVIIGIDHFGASAPGPLVMKEFGFTVENVYNQALILMGVSP